MSARRTRSARHTWRAQQRVGLHNRMRSTIGKCATRTHRDSTYTRRTAGGGIYFKRRAETAEQRFQKGQQTGGARNTLHLHRSVSADGARKKQLHGIRLDPVYFHPPDNDGAGRCRRAARSLATCTTRFSAFPKSHAIRSFSLRSSEQIKVDAAGSTLEPLNQPRSRVATLQLRID